MCSLSFFSLFLSSTLIFILGIYYLFFDYSVFIEWELFSLNGSMVVMTFIFDWMSLIFMSFVMYISSLVIYYSGDYMSDEMNINRFIMIVLMFILSMGFLIISPNLISILLGWDGLGLVSYCLVIYYQNVKSYSAGMLTALSNRIGDVAILISISWMLNFGGWNYIYYYDFISDSFEMKVITMLIILAAMTKSAQIPFSSWLPAAMAAPTPVSALVHSSTLVTAGVYLLIRFSPMLIVYNYGWFLLLIGCMTMFMAGLGANFEFDLKKIIALSTLSQLGLMMSILSMGYLKLAFFHLLSHALFKALLFMCAGSMIHNLNDSQDIRFMGSIVNFMPLTSVCFNVSSLSLCGIPFLAGFYSKDLILEMVCLSWINCLIFFFYFVSTGLTASYSFRLFYYSMSGVNNFYSSFSFNDNSYYISFGMLSLLFVAVFGGSFLSWLIFPIPYMIILPYYLKLLTIFTVALGSYLGYYFSSMYFSNDLFSLNVLSFISFSGSMWFMPYLSTVFISYLPLKMGYYSFKSFDYGWGELFGGQGLYSLFIYLINYIQCWYDSNFKVYLLTFILWMFILMMFFFL
uniref:NADH-ubiquinone oxidoreductase chain 5 n=1 Tax=Chorthippus parallelus erythropus TaxID=588767 RepID=A0A8F0WF77_CHOPA|nr:NADH dehydrogenase subunit 5 [Chorthippus parallelus erythropus]QWM92886.1 NADH dehydrogenase subunit 5 [Chorthippus parallelus erythropus]QWM92899.1 NADH dehydrogenase subunit 5 [Chorthippus parallelus erythropus]QWM92912.1 NADH dehydrogenase subunit 5 [Chorthippus parallelus erythropus]